MYLCVNASQFRKFYGSFSIFPSSNRDVLIQMGLYASGFKTMSKTDMNNYCNRAWKTEFPFLREVDKFALTHSIYVLLI